MGKARRGLGTQLEGDAGGVCVLGCYAMLVHQRLARRSLLSFDLPQVAVGSDGELGARNGHLLARMLLMVGHGTGAQLH